MERGAVWTNGDDAVFPTGFSDINLTANVTAGTLQLGEIGNNFGTNTSGVTLQVGQIVFQSPGNSTTFTGVLNVNLTGANTVSSGFITSLSAGTVPPAQRRQSAEAVSGGSINFNTNASEIHLPSRPKAWTVLQLVRAVGLGWCSPNEGAGILRWGFDDGTILEAYPAWKPETKDSAPPMACQRSDALSGRAAFCGYISV